MMKKDYNYSIWRELEHKEILRLNFSGNLLDLGISKKAEYHQLVKGDYKITIANID